MLGARWKAWSVVLLVSVAACWPRTPLADDEPPSVSIIQLLATPERYEGRLVRVQGVAHFAFEESALYLHREDADCMNSSNGVWLDSDARADLSDKFVIVEGRFTAKDHGHLGAWPGEIQDVTRLERAGVRRDYQRMREPPPPAPGKKND